MRYLNNSITLFDFDNIFFLPSFYKPEKLVKSNGNLIFDKYINKKHCQNRSITWKCSSFHWKTIEYHRKNLSFSSLKLILYNVLIQAVYVTILLLTQVCTICDSWRKAGITRVIKKRRGPFSALSALILIVRDSLSDTYIWDLPPDYRFFLRSFDLFLFAAIESFAVFFSKFF